MRGTFALVVLTAAAIAAGLASASAQNLLPNGDFEAYGPKTANAPLTSSEMWGATPETNPPVYDSDVHLPQPAGEPGGVNGTQNRGSVSVGTQFAEAHVFQTVFDIAPAEEITLTGFIAGNSHSDAPDFAPRNYRIFAVLRDGDLSGPELGRFEQIGTVPWTAFELEGIPTGESVTVEWGFLPGDFGWAIVATHVDELVLFQDPCHEPFADADGDLDVDQDDFGAFQRCTTGGGGDPIPTDPFYECTCFDRAPPTGQIDNADLEAFEACATGPSVPWTPGTPNCP